MANVQHNVLGGPSGTGDKNLHVPGFWGSTDPAVTDPTQVFPGTYWVDTSPGLGKYVLRVRNMNNNGWDFVNAKNLVGASSPFNVITGDQAYNHAIVDASDAGPKLWHHKIDDAATTIDKLWSASKIYSHTNNAAIHRSINDSGSGTTDLWSASKIIAQLALKQNVVAAGQLVPAGAIIDYGGYGAPSGYLLCDGSAVSRTTYAALYAAIGTYWGYGNGSSTFNLPDLRGRFKRMGNYGSGRDPDAGSRAASNPGGPTGDAIGTVQASAMERHVHYLQRPAHWGSNRKDFEYGGDCAGYSVADGNSWDRGYDTDIRGGSTENRPLNAYVTCAIKY